MRRFMVAALACATVAFWLAPGEALALVISNPFNLRSNTGTNTVGNVPGDRLIFGALITPSGDPTAATATQGSTVFDLNFFPSTLFPDQYVRGIPFSGSLTGSWGIEATRGGDSAGPVPTPAILNPELIPLVLNLQITGSGLTPTLTWDLPDLTGLDANRLRVGAYDDTTDDQFFRSMGLSPITTMFTIPSGLLEFGRSYVFSVLLEDLEFTSEFGFFVDNRSITFTGPFTPVPEPGTLLLIGSGLVGMGALTRRRRQK